MNGFFNELDYANYVITVHGRDALRAHQARLAQTNDSTPVRNAIDRMKAAIGAVLIAIGQRVGSEPVVKQVTPARN